MNKKIKQYSALALAAATVIPMACKKESTEDNDENIEDRVVNKVITAVGTSADFFNKDSIDVNGDGQFDFGFEIGGEIYDGNTYAYGVANGKVDANRILSTNQTFSGYTLPVATGKSSGEKVNAASTNWENETYFGYKYNSSKIGFAGDGDKLLGFKFKVGANTHYGWMKVNLAADYKTLTIKELAFNKTADAEIAVGAK